MSSFVVKKEIETTLAHFGKPEEEFQTAVNEYLIKKTAGKIKYLKNEINMWEEKMGMPYEQFIEKTTTDKQFVDKLNRENPMWESDLMNWEFCVEELKEWRQRLEDVLMS